MRGGRRKLPLLAEISGPAPGEARAWALRRADLDALAAPLRGLDEHVVVVAGEQARAAGLALAAAAGAADRRTMLLECDLARPRLAADLGLSPAPGLHEYLRWEATAAEILQPLALAGSRASAASEPLVCVAAGRPAPDPATMLGLQSFRHMAAKLRNAYDLVVLSGPKIDSDPSCLGAIAAEADGTLAAVSPQQAADGGQKVVRSVLAQLQPSALGVVAVAG
jgi:receptor protein-tyrosine kinase